MSKQKYKQIEYHLYNFKRINMKIDEMKEKLNNFSYNHSFNKFIKYKCSNVEREAIKRIELEKKIEKEEKWLELIENVLNEYKDKDKQKYDFIILKYIKKINKTIIERKLKLDFNKQGDMRKEILNHIFFVAVKKNLLKEVH